MRVLARAPGKLVVLGEYGVLEGAPALVFAVNRHCRAEIAESPDGRCRVDVWTDGLQQREFAPGEASGFELIDAVLGVAKPARAYSAQVDTRAFFAGPTKLGLGSSAAALTALAGAWARFERPEHEDPPSMDALIRLHRAFQGGRGSGVDVAASYCGGALRFELGPAGVARTSSVRLPLGVRFAGIFTGRSAATPELIAAFERWRATEPQSATPLLAELGALAKAGQDALADDDGPGFLSCVAAYGEGLDALGTALQRDLVTAEHRRVAAAARSLGVCYKISGAGGGDVGIALSLDSEALNALGKQVETLGFRFIELELDREGLCLEVARERG